MKINRSWRLPDSGSQVSALEVARNRLWRESHLLSRAADRVPVKVRIGLGASLGILFLVSVYFWLTAGSALLIITGSHPFRKAQVSVWLDGSLQFRQEFSGSTRKRYALFGSRVETFSRTLNISSGLHEVEVRVQSAADGFDETRRYKGQFESNQKTRLYLSATRSQLFLNVQNQRAVEVSEAKESGSGFLMYARSLMLTVGGSILSAAIGFLVQDFLKSRKLASSAGKLSA
ncbi:MAG TPA: hypothetical protein VKW78_11565 [Terriglobales bacterium]|nr:hypothetical protein [Terriglobales bacterium]